MSLPPTSFTPQNIDKLLSMLEGVMGTASFLSGGRVGMVEEIRRDILKIRTAGIEAFASEVIPHLEAILDSYNRHVK